MTEDQKILRRIQEGDTSAFEKLVRKYYRNIFALCYRRIGDSDVASDLCQDTFLKLISSVQSIQHRGKFSNYLYTIALNTCTDYLKKKRLYIEDSSTERIEDTEPLPEEWVLTGERNAILAEYLNTLPDIQKEAIILFYFQGEKLKDIAEMTEVNISTVKSRIRRGILKLRSLFEGEYFEEKI